MHSITSFTPWAGLAGGVLIGLAITVWLLLYGRVTGCSGILHDAVASAPDKAGGWQVFYLAGLVSGGLLYLTWGDALPGPQFTVDLQVSWPWMITAGLLVGFGTRLGHGCTSGHGVCGLARLSPRSLVATLVFMALGFASVFVFRHLWGL